MLENVFAHISQTREGSYKGVLSNEDRELFNRFYRVEYKCFGDAVYHFERYKAQRDGFKWPMHKMY